MSFAWWNSSVPEAVRKSFPEKFERMLLDEVRRRTEILRSLGYDRAYAKQRVRANHEWDFERNSFKLSAKKLDEVVDRVYGR